MDTSARPLALVSGAGIRLGRACALKLAESGHDIVIHFNSSQAPAEETLRQVEERGAKGFLVQADLATAAGVESLVSHTASLGRGLKVLVNNASIFFPTGKPESWVEHWDTFQMVNLKSPLLLTVGLLPLLKESGGCVVNIVDIWARYPLRRFLPYSVAKAGLEALTKSLALELAPDVRVNGVSPGAALPPANSDESMDKMLSQVPLQRYGGADSIAEAVEYFSRAGYVTGQILAVDGGRTINL